MCTTISETTVKIISNLSSLELRNAINEAISSSLDDRPLLAKKQLDNIRDMLRLNSNSNNNDINIIESIPEINNIDQEASEIKIFLDIFRTNEDSWLFVCEDNGVSTYYRQEINSDIQSVKCNIEINTNIINIVPIVNEIDLLPDAFLSKSLVPIELNEIYRFSKFRLIVYIRVKIPWPFDDRDTMAECWGIDMLMEEGCVGVIARDFNPIKFPNINSNDYNSNDIVRVNLSLCGALIVPINENKTIITVIFHIDPKLSYIPPFIVNWFCKKLIHHTFISFQKQANDIHNSTMHEIYQKRVETNPEVYGSLPEKLDHFLSSKK